MAIKLTAVGSQLCHQSLTLSPGTFKSHQQAGVSEEKKNVKVLIPGLKHRHIAKNAGFKPFRIIIIF